MTRGEEQGGYFSLAHATTSQTMGLARPLSHIQGLLTCTRTNRDSSIVLPWGGGGPALQSGAVGERQDQFCAALSSLCAVVTGTMDINIDYSCGRAMDPDMAPGSSPGHFDRHGPRCGPSSRFLFYQDARSLCLLTPIAKNFTTPSLP